MDYNSSSYMENPKASAADRIWSSCHLVVPFIRLCRACLEIPIRFASLVFVIFRRSSHRLTILAKSILVAGNIITSTIIVNLNFTECNECMDSLSNVLGDYGELESSGLHMLSETSSVCLSYVKATFIM